MNRRLVRENTVKFLYTYTFHKDENIDEVLETFFDIDVAPFETEIEILELQESKEYFIGMVKGVQEHLEEIDAYIKAQSKDWDISRMPILDLSIIRLSIYEILYCEEDIPTAVSINEAVEIAKKFGGIDSPSFINAIIDNFAKAHKK